MRQGGVFEKRRMRKHSWRAGAAPDQTCSPLTEFCRFGSLHCDFLQQSLCCLNCWRVMFDLKNLDLKWQVQNLYWDQNSKSFRIKWQIFRSAQHFEVLIRTKMACLYWKLNSLSLCCCLNREKSCWLGHTVSTNSWWRIIDHHHPDPPQGSRLGCWFEE